MQESTEKFELNEQTQQEIERWLAKFPKDQRRSAIVGALFAAQEQNGNWLSQAAMDAVADYLQIPPIEVYEVATFYDMFETKPRAKHKIGICTNVSCMLRGSDEIVAAVKQKLGIGLGETTADGKFTVRELECMAACGGAPMCQVNDREYHENLTPEKMLALIDQLEQEAN
jgi:NADH-quinone oxidoreductase subunit E